MELAEEVDWQRHRQDILERMRKEEELRQRWIEKREKLEESWEKLVISFENQQLHRQKEEAAKYLKRTKRN